MNLDTALEELADDPNATVELDEIALHIAGDEYPNLPVQAYLARLDRLADGVRPSMHGSFHERVDTLMEYLFQEVGFIGNQAAYYDPRNSYLNDVLDRCTGIPITLSLVSKFVGERLGMIVHGVALPGHFVAIAEEEQERVVFDPFDGGRRLAAGDCESLVREAAGVEMKVSIDQLVPASSVTIVVRMLTNLKGAYLRENDFRRAARVIERLRQVTPSDWQQARDQGACLLQCGQAGRAIDLLELYISEMPFALDKEAVEKLLRRARTEVARWN